MNNRWLHHSIIKKPKNIVINVGFLPIEKEKMNDRPFIEEFKKYDFYDIYYIDKNKTMCNKMEQNVKKWNVPTLHVINKRIKMFPFPKFENGIENIKLENIIKENALQTREIECININVKDSLECFLSLGRHIHNIKKGIMKVIVKKEDYNLLNNSMVCLKENKFLVSRVLANSEKDLHYDIFFRKK